MKELLCSLICCMAFGFFANAQSNDERQVAAAVESLKKAMINADKSRLVALTADELSYGHSSGTIEDKAAFVETLASGRSDFVSIDLSGQTIEIAGSTALVRHRLSADTNDGGKPGHVNLGILLVWQKQKGEWKLLARQAYKI